MIQRSLLNLINMPHFQGLSAEVRADVIQWNVTNARAVATDIMRSILWDEIHEEPGTRDERPVIRGTSLGRIE
jgi:hypothetical protein